MWNGFDLGIFRWFFCIKQMESRLELRLAVWLATWYAQQDKKIADMASINFKMKDCLLGLPHLCNIFYVSVIYSKNVGKVEASKIPRGESRSRAKFIKLGFQQFASRHLALNNEIICRLEDCEERFLDTHATWLLLNRGRCPPCSVVNHPVLIYVEAK